MPTSSSSSSLTSPQTPRTPGGVGSHGKKKLSVRGLDAPKTVGGTPKGKARLPSVGDARHTMIMPDDFHPKNHIVWVYEHTQNEGFSVDNVPGKRQGVWQQGYSATVSPTELWMFPYGREPSNVEGSKHIHGVWGLFPDATDPGEPLPDDLTNMDPMQLWFFPPQAKVPKYFKPRGIWTYPLVKRDITQLQPEQAGFLHVGDSVKNHKLDVGGSWKMLYRRDGLPELPIGPGMSPPAGKNKPKARQLEMPKPLTLFVQTPQGRKIPFEGILPTDTLDTIKQNVEDLEGTPKDEARLVHDGKDMTDDQKTMKDYGLKDGDVLQLQGITIYVQPPKESAMGPKLTFGNLDPQATTIDQVQDLIEKNGGIPRKFQRLTFHGAPLSRPEKSLRDYGIVHESTLILEPLEIQVKTPQGTLIPLKVDPNETLGDIKKQVQRKTGIPIDEQRLQKKGKDLEGDRVPLVEHDIQHGDVLDLQGMQIFVQDWNGDLSELDVDPSNTLEDVKDKLQQQNGISKQFQILSYQGKILPNDSKTLREYGIPNQATLVLEPMDIQARTAKGKLLDLQVIPSDTIEMVKQQLEEKHGIPEEEQRLTFKGKHLGDGTTIEGNRIPNGAILDLEPMMIFVTDPKGRRFELQNLDPSDTIPDIQSKIEAEQGIPKSQQRLVFQGKPLTDDPSKKTLRDHGIRHKSTLALEPMQVQVQLPSGQIIPLQVEPKDTIGDVKAQLKDKHGIPISEQRLQKENGAPLDDPNKTLADAGIKHGDLIQMKPMEVIVRDLDNGREYPFEMEPTDSVDDLKQLVEQKTGVPKREQQLLLGKKPLDKDQQTLRKCGIQHGSVVDLKPMGMQIIVKDWKSKTTTFDVKPSDTIGSIRDRLAPIKDMDPDKQILVHKDTMLDDNAKTLEDYKIPNLATINLDRFKIYVEVPNHGKFLFECEPFWKYKRVQDAVEARFKIKPEVQQPTFRGTNLTDVKATIGSYGVGYKDTVVVNEANIPEYEVKIGAWQDPFSYSPKSPVTKKVGVRKKTTWDHSKDYFAEGKGGTALDVDIWSKKEKDEK